MATAKTLREWAATVRHWATQIDDAETAKRANFLAAEMERLAAWKEVADRQLV